MNSLIEYQKSDEDHLSALVLYVLFEEEFALLNYFFSSYWPKSEGIL